MDIRDYRTSFKDPIPGAINIPHAYLKRFYKEIPNKKILVSACDSIEKNLAVRFLLKKKFVDHSGFQILSKDTEVVYFHSTEKQNII